MYHNMWWWNVWALSHGNVAKMDHTWTNCRPRNLYTFILRTWYCKSSFCNLPPPAVMKFSLLSSIETHIRNIYFHVTTVRVQCHMICYRFCKLLRRGQANNLLSFHCLPAFPEDVIKANRNVETSLLLLSERSFLGKNSHKSKSSRLNVYFVFWGFCLHSQISLGSEKNLNVQQGKIMTPDSTRLDFFSFKMLTLKNCIF